MRDQPGQYDADGLAAVIAEYLTRIDQGELVCREAFLAEHPAHIDALKAYFADVDLIDRLASNSASGLPHEAAAMPRQFGDYDLIEEIGRGGMGIVYRARERSTGRLVAIKMLLHGLFLSSAELARFRNESRTAANLRHSGIMPIFHVGEHQGQLFFTMPLIQGGNLAQQLDRGRAESKRGATLLLAIAEAVAVAHRHHIVHRDLKPANILLDEQGNPVVADFGLARQIGEGNLGLTATGDLLGTPNYMAPEQVNGPHEIVGPAADVYALGAILYALLVGQPPFQSGTISETLQKICSAEPVRPRQVFRSVPRDLETICLKCLEKSPDNRYCTAEELTEDLRRFLAGKPLLAKPVSTIERSRRWFVRNPLIGTLAAGIALALITGTCFSVYYAAQARDRERQALANLYAADMNLAQQHVRSGAVASALRLLERHRDKSGDISGQGWEWRHLWHQCNGELRRFEGPQGAVYTAAFSPDGRTVAAAGADRTVWLWETATGKVLHKLTGHTAAVRDLAFAPDGRRMVTVGDDRVGIVSDVGTGQRVAIFSGHEHPLTTVAFSADGSLIATGGNSEANVNLWDTSTGKLLQSLDLGPAESLAFSPDEKQLAVAGRDGCIRICERLIVGSWRITETIRAHADVCRDVAWNSDGARLASSGADRAVKLWDAKLWKELAAIDDFKESVYSVSFRPDGRRLAMAARNEPLKVWDFDEQQMVAELLGHTALVTRVEYCPQGWRLVTASEDGTVRLWDAARSSDHDRLNGHLGKVRSVAFNSTGAILASAGDDSSIILWNSVNCLPFRVLRSHAGAIYDIAYSPDGGHLAAVEHNGDLRVWRVADGSESFALKLKHGPLVGVAWVANGRRLVVQAVDGTIALIDSKSRQKIATWRSPKGPQGGIAFNHEGTLLVTAGGDHSIRVWQTETQALTHKLIGHRAPTVNAIFNPDGSLIASSSNDHTIRLWDAATGRHLRTLTGHNGTPYGLAFSPDGTRLASSSTEQTLKLWDVATGLELQSLVGHTNWARDVAFSPDGQHLASAGHDDLVRVWHAPQKDEWATKREAAALVKHLAARVPARERLIAAIKQDQAVNRAVRAAAIRHAEQFLSHWRPMLEGHRAAERREWAAAIEAFERVTTLAPDDATHWYWFAMASAGADRHESHQQACDQLLQHFNVDASEYELLLIVTAWLIRSHDEEKLASLQPIMDEFARRMPRAPQMNWLYDLRIKKDQRRSFHDTTTLHSLGAQPGDWYIRALAWLKLGNTAEAFSAYQAGNRQARVAIYRWDANLFYEMLRREVEELLRFEPSRHGNSIGGASPDATSTSGVPSSGEPSRSEASQAPK